MKLGTLVLRFRAIDDTFSKVGGVADYELARRGTLKDEMAFILPIQESAEPNRHDTAVIQEIVEQFAVVVALKNDTDHEDKKGFKAFNRLHEVRKGIFKAFLGLDIGYLYEEDEEFVSETLIEYVGGLLLGIDRGYMWYQFTFQYGLSVETAIVDINADGFLDTMHTDIEIMPSDNIPVTEPLPITTFTPDAEHEIDFVTLRSELEDE